MIMAKNLRTKTVEITLPVKSAALDMLSIPTETADADILRLDAVSADYPLKPEDVETFAVEAGGEVSSTPVSLYSGDSAETKTTKIDFKNISIVNSKSLEVELPPPPETFDVECRPPAEVETFYSPYLENAPIAREALDLKKIPYPVISDYIIALAERNNTNYTNISLIGIFDPVPTHLATGLTIDSVRGILKYYIRETPIEVNGPRIARVVYGRLRTTGDIVSAVLPCS